MSQGTAFHNYIKLLLILILGAAMWSVQVPSDVPENAWHLMIIFLCTILGVILHPFPIGAITLMGVLACVLTKTLTLAECLGGFGDQIVWLIVFAFFISDGIIKTGLGNRIAYNLISMFGRNTLGLAYSLVFTDLVLSPAIPSVTARGGGILYPVAKALSNVFSEKEKANPKNNKNGGFFMSVCLQSNVITSAMFLTAMAANPVAVKLAGLMDIEITWFGWALAAFVPGMTCLVLMPLLIYYHAYPPSIKHSDIAPELARKKLAEMGAISKNEVIMLGIFITLIFLWIRGGALFGISATTTALIGYILLILFKLVNFEDTMNNKAAWHTFIWFASLVMMSSFLARMGIMGWINSNIKIVFADMAPMYAIICISLFYFYMHYIFASATAHITIFFTSFTMMLIGLGIPAYIAALMMTFLSIVSSGLTHFGIASTPIFFGAGYVKVERWFYIGFLTSILYLLIWTFVGGAWWKIIGLW